MKDRMGSRWPELDARETDSRPWSATPRAVPRAGLETILDEWPSFRFELADRGVSRGEKPRAGEDMFWLPEEFDDDTLIRYLMLSYRISILL